jgi:hypothetical protein
MESLQPDGRNRTLPRGVLVLVALLFVAVLLDCVTLVGLQFAPDTVEKMACTLRPVTYVAWPFIPKEWFDYVSMRCMSYPTETSANLILFMVKTALAIFGFAIAFPAACWMALKIKPSSFKRRQETNCPQRYSRDGANSDPLCCASSGQLEIGHFSSSRELSNISKIAREHPIR